eukprot:CAMPEP_0206033742 /NCGR_PEP_ID=MMETSP1466-20131121/887_1 /ASSEMBLY_ACC=CAM_ASM_001126 /TAXON_ID=44452 /ORGANISM="Pavlova gyrans, Strain CCMP608" /LENGTH=33 /DNA_ID= /DNA_START= /DNA_END= /DNA_ORIENTATION=
MWDMAVGTPDEFIITYEKIPSYGLSQLDALIGI